MSTLFFSNPLNQLRSTPGTSAAITDNGGLERKRSYRPPLTTGTWWPAISIVLVSVGLGISGVPANAALAKVLNSNAVKTALASFNRSFSR
ncbi:hypothetical protein D9M71_289970 [compost metagenome]